MGSIKRVWKQECDCGCDNNYNCGKYNVIGYLYNSVCDVNTLYFGTQKAGEVISWDTMLIMTDSQERMLKAILDLSNNGSKYIVEENCEDLF